MEGRNLQYSEVQQPLRFTEMDVEALFSESLFRELIAHRRFQRLKDIRFLGAIDYAVAANGKPLHIRQTRFDHSVGVGLLAQWFADEAGYADSERFLLVSAALLHDIGHGPLSHSLETVFTKHFGIDHHTATISVIRGLDCDKTESIASVLKAHAVDPDAVIDALSNPNGEHAPRLMGKFNLDTLEAIPRSSSYLSRHLLNSPPKLVMKAAHFGGASRRATLDQFWTQKDFVYRYLINGPIGVQFDMNAQDYMREHIESFSRESFFALEGELRRQHPLLFSRLAQPRWDSVSLVAKRYLINRDGESDGERYLVTKEPTTISFERRPKDFGSAELEYQRLFKDDIKIRRN